jgi:hypothetical protein
MILAAGLIASPHFARLRTSGRRRDRSPRPARTRTPTHRRRAWKMRIRPHFLPIARIVASPGWQVPRVHRARESEQDQIVRTCPRRTMAGRRERSATAECVGTAGSKATTNNDVYSAPAGPRSPCPQRDCVAYPVHSWPSRTEEIVQTLLREWPTSNRTASLQIRRAKLRSYVQYYNRVSYCPTRLCA